MIPKIIHYCWFGGNEIPEHDKKCIESWKKYCPDYKIIRWDESNYDYKKNSYMREAYEAKKWGFVPDYARLDIVYEHGGIYLDTDVELVKNIDELLEHKAYMGFEVGGEFVSPGLGFGAEKNFPLFKKMMEEIYGDRKFKLGEGNYDTTPSPTLNVEFLLKYGLKLNNQFQVIEDMAIYPSDWFCPIDTNSAVFNPTENTHSIHHFHASWLTPEEKKARLITQNLVRKFGREKGERIGGVVCKPYRIKMHLRTKGIRGTFAFAMHKIMGNGKKNAGK